eukprot:5431623-Prymnesium_polylepis.1
MPHSSFDSRRHPRQSFTCCDVAGHSLRFGTLPEIRINHAWHNSGPAKVSRDAAWFVGGCRARANLQFLAWRWLAGRPATTPTPTNRSHAHGGKSSDPLRAMCANLMQPAIAGVWHHAPLAASCLAASSTLVSHAHGARPRLRHAPHAPSRAPH